MKTAQAGEQEIKYLEAIINSMTKEERANPDIINPARKRRIAAGSGTDVPRCQPCSQAVQADEER